MWREGRSLRPPIFQKPFPVWGGFRARQADQGAIHAGMVVERWRHYRTNFGRVAGALPELRSGLIMGESRSQGVLFDRSCHAKPLNNTPLFLETISFLVLITGESGLSGRDFSLNARAKLA